MDWKVKMPRNKREKKDKKLTRLGRDIRVPVLVEEKELIKQKADKAGMTLAAYARKSMLGQKIVADTNYENIDGLAACRADLARTGNLLKLALTKNVVSLSQVEKLIVDLEHDRLKLFNEMNRLNGHRT